MELDVIIKKPFPVTVHIYTLNEAINLPHCLASLQWCDDIVVIDSFSTDGTLDIARKHGARVYQHRFEGFGSQRNWALENIESRYQWILILDADERVPIKLAEELATIAGDSQQSNAAYRVRRRFYMWGYWLRFSSLYPNWVVRFIRAGKVKYVNRGHAETQKVDGLIGSLACDLIDENHKGVEAWHERQNTYSGKDAEYELSLEKQPVIFSHLFSADPLVRRKTLKLLASRLPGRPFIYFIYSYVFRLGFLDGFHGLRFCLMKSRYQAMVVTKKRALRKGAISQSLKQGDL